MLNPERMPRLQPPQYYDITSSGERVLGPEEIQRMIQNKLKKNGWPGINKITDQLIAPPLPPGELLPDLEEIIPVMVSVFDGCMMMMCSGEFPFFDLYDESLHTDYYEDILMQDLDKIVFITMSCMSNRLMGYLLYFMQRDFVAQWIKNNIVRPNLYKAIETSRARIEKRTFLDEETETIEKMQGMLRSITGHYLIDHKYNGIDDEVKEFEELELKNKGEFVDNYLDGLEYFVPDCLIAALSSDEPYHALGHDEDIKTFMDEYVKTNKEDSFIALCRRNSKIRDKKVIDTRAKRLYLERASYQKIMEAPRIDGFVYSQLQTLERVLKRKDNGDDLPVIDTHRYLANIKYIMTRENDLRERATVDDTYVIFTNVESGAQRLINYTNNEFLYTYEDPYFIIFGAQKGATVRTMVEGKFDILKTSGLCRDDEFDLHKVGKVFLPTEMTYEELEKHRDEQIKRVMSKMGNDPYITGLLQGKLGEKGFTELRYLKADDILEIKPYMYIRAESELELGYKLLELKKFGEYATEKIKKLEAEVQRRRYVDLNYNELYKDYLEKPKQQFNGNFDLFARVKDPDPFDIDKLERIRELEAQVAELQARDPRNSWKNMTLWKIPRITNAQL